MDEYTIPDFILKYSAATINRETDRKFMDLNSKYQAALKTLKENIVVQQVNAKMYQDRTGEKTEVNFANQLKQLENIYKAKADRLAQESLSKEERAMADKWEKDEAARKTAEEKVIAQAKADAEEKQAQEKADEQEVKEEEERIRAAMKDQKTEDLLEKKSQLDEQKDDVASKLATEKAAAEEARREQKRKETEELIRKLAENKQRMFERGG